MLFRQIKDFIKKTCRGRLLGGRFGEERAGFRPDPKEPPQGPSHAFPHQTSFIDGAAGLAPFSHLRTPQCWGSRWGGPT